MKRKTTKKQNVIIASLERHETRFSCYNSKIIRNCNHGSVEFKFEAIKFEIEGRRNIQSGATSR